MSRTELDLPVLVSPEQIRRREFVTTRRGYDPDQVRNYLEQVARQVEQMEGMIREARLESEASARTQAPRVDPYEQLAARLAGLIRAAEAEAERIRRDSMEEAERALREARADADRIRLDAQAKAEEAREAADRALREAREKADRTIAGLDTRRAALMDQLATMQGRLLGVAKELEAAIDRRDEAVTIPDEEAPEEPSDRTETGSDEPDRVAADAAYEELWAGDEAPDLTIPDIPPLDLGWGDEDDA
jgi:DivIVA domain-containing protein